MTNTVKESIEFSSHHDWPPRDADGFMKWFAKKLNNIPEQYRDTAKIEFVGGYDCDDTIEFSWRQPQRHEMTDEKHASRLGITMEDYEQIRSDIQDA